jgi:hypothetical protein
MIDQKIINKVLIITVLLLVANYISDGKILDIIKKYLIKAKETFLSKIEGFYAVQDTKEFVGRTYPGLKPGSSTTPPIIHDTEFPYVYKKKKINEPNMRKLYHFLQSLITINRNHYDLTSSNSKEQIMSKSDKEALIRYFQKTFNTGEFRFANIVILDTVVYYNNPRGKELRPFRISTDVYLNNEPIGKITIHTEMFLRLDAMFYGPLNAGFPCITRLKLLRRDKLTDPLPPMNEYDEEINATENSLIPDEITFSTEESYINTETDEDN